MSKKKYRSQYEHKVAAYLLDHHVSFEYEPWTTNYHFSVTNGFCPECDNWAVKQSRWYTPDFVLGNGNVVESKGKLDASGRTKILAILSTSLDVTRDNFKLLLMRDNKIGAKRKDGTRQTYSGWCDKNNITYHVSVKGEVPSEWLEKS